MKIYTKTGDKGETSLLGGKRVRKDDLRIEAYGTIDELNSYMGLLSDQEACASFRDFIRGVQQELFTIGSLLAADPEKTEIKLPKLSQSKILEIESSIDQLEQDLPPLKNFILPGGHPASSTAHVARCICRRSERRVVEMNAEIPLNPDILVYLNRLSDWLFVFSRYLLILTGNQEIPWIPQKS